MVALVIGALVLAGLVVLYACFVVSSWHAQDEEDAGIARRS